MLVSINGSSSSIDCTGALLRTAISEDYSKLVKTESDFKNAKETSIIVYVLSEHVDFHPGKLNFESLLQISNPGKYLSCTMNE